MTLTKMQWLRSQKWFTYIICVWGVAIFLFMAYHFALAGNRDDAGKWFLLAIFTFMLSKAHVLFYAIFDGVRERRAGLEWVYLNDGSSVLISKEAAAKLKKHFAAAASQGNPQDIGFLISQLFWLQDTWPRTVEDVKSLKTQNDRLQEVIAKSAIGISIAQSETQLRHIGLHLENVILEEFPRDSGWRTAIQEKRIQANTAR